VATAFSGAAFAQSTSPSPADRRKSMLRRIPVLLVSSENRVSDAASRIIF
jgi:hypothetical protein